MPLCVAPVSQHAAPADYVHACILARPEQLNDPLRTRPCAQNIDPFAEHLPSDDPLVGAAPCHQRGSKKDEPKQQNVMRNICVRKEINDCGEQKREKPKNQEQPKVDLPAG